MADYEKAETLASDKLIQYKVSDTVVPIFEIAEAEGLSVKVITMPDRLKGVSGFLDPTERTIYVNAEDAPTRQRFTVAHELGHYLLEHDPAKYGVLLRFPEFNGEDEEEKEANCFAANLLVPKESLKEVLKKYSLTNEDEPVLAQLFGVSKAVIRFRMKHV